MANSVATLSRRLCRSLLFNTRTPQLPRGFYSSLSSGEASDFEDSTITEEIGPESDLPPPSSEPSESPSKDVRDKAKMINLKKLENGFDTGIFKAILVGQVGKPPQQKQLKSGFTLTIFPLGTGGVQNSRRPFQNEEPMEYANRCSVQWHRVCVYPEGLGHVVAKQLMPGSIVYLEGNLETKIFTDPLSGVVRRVREIAIRKTGRLVVLSNNGNAQGATPDSNKSLGYY